MIVPGRVCIKKAGRDAGERVVVKEIVDDIYVIVVGSKGEKKCNKRHLIPTDEIVPLSEESK